MLVLQCQQCRVVDSVEGARPSPEVKWLFFQIIVELYSYVASYVCISMQIYIL